MYSNPIPNLLDDAEAVPAARDFAAAVRAGAVHRDRAGAHPAAELEALDRSGLLGIRVPRADGGPEASALTLVEVVRTIAAADPSLGQLPQGHYGNVERLRAATPAELPGVARDRLLAGVLRGERIADAMSERGTTHGRAHATRLHRDAHGVLRLTGAKHYVTGGPSATWLAVGARGEDGRKVIAFVLRESPGIRVRDDWTGMGQRSTASGSIALEDVAVDPAFIWREAADVPDPSRPLAKLLHGAVSAGIAEGALAEAAEFIVRTARPRPAAALAGVERAAEDPYVALRLGELVARTGAAAAFVRDVARTIDAEAADDIDAAVAAAHAYAGEVAVTVTSEIFTLMGAAAADERHDLHRHWRDARTHSLQDARDWRLRLAGQRLLAHAEHDLSETPAQPARSQ